MLNHLEQLDEIDDLTPEELSPLFLQAQTYIESELSTRGLTASNVSTSYGIHTFVGDDVSIITNQPERYLAANFCTKQILHLTLSEHDLHVSKSVGHFAEEWFIKPPSIWTSFTGTQMYSKGKLPMTLDTVRVKNLSPIRKQSSQENDLESKFHLLSASANWTHPLWLSYPKHQLAQILATVTLDFSNEISFPFLHKKDGGCGGNPPWNQVDTASAYLFHFRKGKSKYTVEGIMGESIAITEGSMDPMDSVFLRFSHLAASGEPEWYRQISSLVEAKSSLNKDQIKRLLEVEPLPEDIQKQSRVILHDPYTRAVCESLYAKSVILTELDVKLKLLQQEKAIAVRGQIPYTEVCKSIEGSKTRIKRKSIKLLTTLFSSRKWEKPHLGTTNVVHDYVKFNLEHYGHSGRFLSKSEFQIFSNFSISQQLDLRGKSYLVSTISERLHHVPIDMNKELNDWVQNSVDLLDPPDGVIDDDTRILQNVGKVSGPVAIVTDDRLLIAKLKSRYKQPIVRIEVRDYVQSLLSQSAFQPESGLFWYDYFRHTTSNIPITICRKYFLRHQTMFFYDVANIFRRSGKLRLINGRLQYVDLLHFTGQESDLYILPYISLANRFHNNL